MPITMATIVERLRRELHKEEPRAKVRPTVVDGTLRRQFTTAKRDRTKAVAGDACHCTMACGISRTFGHIAAFEYTFAYLLESVGKGEYEVRKYQHDGRNVAKELDTGGIGVWHTIVTLRPPNPVHRTGAQAKSARRKRKAKNQNRRSNSQESTKNRRESIRRTIKGVYTLTENG